MNDLRLAFIRARLVPTTPSNELDDAIAIATHHREDVAQCAMNLFVELVGIPALWEQVSRDLRRILVEDSMKLVERRAIVARVLRLCLDAGEWLPFLAAWNLFKRDDAHQPITSEETCARIHRGDFRAIGCTDTTPQLIAHLRAEMSKHGKAMPHFLRETTNMLEWTSSEPTASNLRRFAIFSMIRATDPRPGVHPAACKDIQVRARADSSLEDAKCAIICASSQALCTIAPGHDTEWLIDRARERMGMMSLAEDRAIDASLAHTPLSATIDVNPGVRAGQIMPLARLRADTFIGFDTLRRVIAHGPLSEDEARACANYARICSDLGVPRSGRAHRIHVADDGSRFFVFDIDISHIPAKIARPHAILKAGAPIVRELFIINCLWRAVMNFAGRSASADLLVVDGQVFGYNEHRIGSPGIAAAHRDVLEEFARDVARYEPILRAWAVRLREIAQIEKAARIKFPERARMTGIDAGIIGECAERALRIIDVWRAIN